MRLDEITKGVRREREDQRPKLHVLELGRLRRSINEMG